MVTLPLTPAKWSDQAWPPESPTSITRAVNARSEIQRDGGPQTSELTQEPSCSKSSGPISTALSSTQSKDFPREDRCHSHRYSPGNAQAASSGPQYHDPKRLSTVSLEGSPLISPHL